MNYKQKYTKYKMKYLQLKDVKQTIIMTGGNIT